MIGLPTSESSRMSAGSMPRLARERQGELAQGAADRVRHQDRAAGIHHRVGHPAHQVFAEPDLGVHHSAGSDEFAALEIAEMRGDRRRADVDGHAECLVVKARPHGDDLGLAVHRRGHFPLALAQHGLQCAQYRKIAGEPGEPPFLLERVHQAPQVAGRILHVRLLHFDVVQADDWIQLDLARIGILAHDLAMDLAAGRNVHDHVALHERRAGETVTGRQPPPARVALLDLADGGNARSARAHAVLGEFALGDHAPGSVRRFRARRRPNRRRRRACARPAGVECRPGIARACRTA